MRVMYGTLVGLLRHDELIQMVTDVSLEVQQFAVWEKDAKDGSGFVGYCYLDLFPRGAGCDTSVLSHKHAHIRI